jgi:competence protein ComEC
MIVAQTCAEFGIRYQVQPTLRAAAGTGKTIGGDVKTAIIVMLFPPLLLMAQQSRGAWTNIGPSPAAVTAPIVWLHFGAIPVWTIPANVLAEPAMVPLICLSLGASVIAPFSASAAASLAWLAGWCAAWITFVARLVSGLPGAQLESGTSVALLGAIVLGAMALVRLPSYRRRAAAVVLVSATCFGGVGWITLHDRGTWAPPTGLRVSFLDVGQGDGILVEAPGVAILVDQGPPEADVARQLRRMGLRALTAVLLTHPQRDHIGGAAPQFSEEGPSSSASGSRQMTPDE